MAKEGCNHITSHVTWPTRTKLAWLSLVTTARTGRWWTDMKEMDLIHVTYTTKERTSLSWWVSSMFPSTVSSSSSTSASVLLWSMAFGFHVTPWKWTIGAEQLLIVVSAHAECTTTAQMKKKFVTVIRMTENGGRTVASSLKRHIYQLNSWGLEIRVIKASKATIPWESSNVMESPDLK